MHKKLALATLLLFISTTYIHTDTQKQTIENFKKEVKVAIQKIKAEKQKSHSATNIFFEKYIFELKRLLVKLIDKEVCNKKIDIQKCQEKLFNINTSYAQEKSDFKKNSQLYEMKKKYHKAIKKGCT